MKVTLNQIQKKIICINFAKHLKEIRSLLHLNQKEFAKMSGISTDRLSRIENEHVVMTWSQLLAIVAVCNMNTSTKEYLFITSAIPKKVFQYLQQLDEEVPPNYNVELRTEVIETQNLRENKREEEEFR